MNFDVCESYKSKWIYDSGENYHPKMETKSEKTINNGGQGHIDNLASLNWHIGQ